MRSGGPSAAAGGTMDASLSAQTEQALSLQDTATTTAAEQPSATETPARSAPSPNPGAAGVEAAMLAAARERASMGLPLALSDEEGDGVDVLGHINKAPSLNVSQTLCVIESVEGCANMSDLLHQMSVEFMSMRSAHFTTGPLEHTDLFALTKLCIHTVVPRLLQKRKEKTREKKQKKKIAKAKAATTQGGDGSVSGGSDGDDGTAGVEEKSEDYVFVETVAAEGGGKEGDGAEHGKAKEASGSAAGGSSVVTGGTAAGAGAGGDKQGKRGKRLEKEAQAERQQRAQALQARLDSEAEQLRRRQEQLQSSQAHSAGAEGSGAAGTTAAAASGAATGSTSETGTVQRCTTCGGAFTDAVKYRQHFR